MKIYLDVSCLNRPFDDQSQPRVRLESEAVLLVMERFDAGKWQQDASQMSVLEVQAISDSKRRHRVALLLPPSDNILPLSDSMILRAEALRKLGLPPADAVHVAAAEYAQADVFLTCDDRLLRRANKLKNELSVLAQNPVDWLEEQSDASNAGTNP